MTDQLFPAGKGGRQAPVACLVSTKLVFTGTSGKRTGVYIAAYASPVYVKVTNPGDADPTTTSTDYDFAIAAGATVLLPLKGSLALWAQSAGNVSAVEVYG